MNQLILFIVGLLLVLNGDYTESMMKEYNCREAKYEDNPLNKFVERCAPLAWDDFFRLLDVKKNLNELTPFLFDEAQKLSKQATKLLEQAEKKKEEPPRNLPGIEPPMHLMFEALNKVAPGDVKVIILGQDPTPQQGMATGLAFSVNDAKSVGTVVNVLLEVALEGFAVNINNGDLSSWADKGVLLLNTALTVRRGAAGSHLKLNWWISFTEMLVKYISDKAEPSVWLIWGKEAQYFKNFINERHYVIEGGHPSALGGIGRNDFVGKGYFRCANQFLNRNGRGIIDWRLAMENVLDPCP